jgi:hypothetical protein
VPVEVSWIDASSNPARVRIRLVRFLTVSISPTLPTRTALALRFADTTVVRGSDSAYVVLPGTRVRVPGLATLLPDAVTANSVRTAPGAPAGGAWIGALGRADAMPVLPNQPVDVCWVLRVAPGTTPAALMNALAGATSGSANASASGSITGNAGFSPLRASGTSGGSGGRRWVTP